MKQISQINEFAMMEKEIIKDKLFSRSFSKYYFIINANFTKIILKFSAS